MGAIIIGGETVAIEGQNVRGFDVEVDYFLFLLVVL